jgi:hypothetical protein
VGLTTEDAVEAFETVSSCHQVQSFGSISQRCTQSTAVCSMNIHFLNQNIGENPIYPGKCNSKLNSSSIVRSDFKTA